MFQLFPAGQGAFGANPFEPIIQRLNLGAGFGHFGAGMIMEEGANLFEALFDLLNGHCVILDLERLGTAGAREDHQELGPKLLQ